MQTDILEVYQKNVLPLTEDERLRLVALIVNGISRRTRSAAPPKRKTGDITKFFGMSQDGDPNGSDNEAIDRDLARAYLDDYEQSKS